VNNTRIGMLVRAGASNRQMAEFMGVRVGAVFAFVFALGAGLAALAGALMAPISAVQIGMGEAILIPALVVIVIGGIGSVRGAFVAACWSGWWIPRGAPSCRRRCARCCRLRSRPTSGRRWPASPCTC
jgi:amino acid/amide ABC transporter membrane protein 1, HAAT family (TC 3.A.1.4.-)